MHFTVVVWLCNVSERANGVAQHHKISCISQEKLKTVPLQIVIPPGGKNRADFCRSPCLTGTYWVYIEMSEFENGFLFTTDSCRFAVIGVFTHLHCRLKALNVCHC